MIAPAVPLTAAQRNERVSHSEALNGCVFLLSAGAGTLYWRSGSLVRRS